jgi:hypothetical protein
MAIYPGLLPSREIAWRWGRCTNRGCWAFGLGFAYHPFLIPECRECQVVGEEGYRTIWERLLTR